MIEKRVYLEGKDRCTFGVLSQVWDNGYVKIAYIKVPKYEVLRHVGRSIEKKMQLDFICATFEELKFIPSSQIKIK